MCATKNEGGLIIWQKDEQTAKAASESEKRNRCKDRIQHAGTQQCRIHPCHLHPRHKQGAGTGSSKDGQSAEAVTLILKAETGWTTVHPALLKSFPFGSNLGQQHLPIFCTVEMVTRFMQTDFVFSGMCLTAHGSLPRTEKYPVAVPGRNFACRSRLVSCRPLPLAHLALSAPRGARFAPHRTVFFSPFRLPSSPKYHIKTGDIRRYLLFLWGG